jgi:hypothetical protein
MKIGGSVLQKKKKKKKKMERVYINLKNSNMIVRGTIFLKKKTERILMEKLKKVC